MFDFVESGCATIATGSGVYIKLTTPVDLSYDKDHNISFYWNVAADGSDRTLFSESDTANFEYFFRVASDNRTVYFYPGATDDTVVFDSDFLDDNLYNININYDSATTTWTVSRTNITIGSALESKSTDLSGLASWGLSFDEIGRRGDDSRYFAGDIFSLQISNNGVLLAYLPFSNNAYDVSGNNNHGTWYGTEAYGTQDVFHYNLCNGLTTATQPRVGDFATGRYIAYGDILQDFSTFYVTFDMKTSVADGGVYAVLGAGFLAATPNGWGFGFVAGDFLLMVRNAGTLKSAAISESIVADGNWHTITGVYNGFILLLYVDGVELAGNASATVSSYTATEPFTVAIREEAGLYLYPFTGQIANISCNLSGEEFTDSLNNATEGTWTGTPTYVLRDTSYSEVVTIPYKTDKNPITPRPLSDDVFEFVEQPSGVWHNGAETKIKMTEDADVIAAEFNYLDSRGIALSNSILFEHPAGTAKAISYEDIKNLLKYDFFLFDYSEEFKFRNFLIYVTSSGLRSTLLKDEILKHKYINNFSLIERDLNNAIVFDLRGYPQWLLRYI